MDTLWELRFIGRPGSIYTPDDVTAHVGYAGSRTIRVAALVHGENLLEDAQRGITEGLFAEATINLRAIAFALRHELDAP